MTIRIQSVLLLFCLLSGEAVLACSPGEVANAEEITRKADVIVLGRVIKYERGQNLFEGDVTFRILEVLKGRYSKDTLVVHGHTEKYEGRIKTQRIHGGPPYNYVRDGGIHGNCYAYDYEMNKNFLLFLKKEFLFLNRDSPYWAPLSATNEEVSGPDDPWVIWVKGRIEKKF